MSKIATIRSNAQRSLIPPPRLKLLDWIETHVRLPEGSTALPGAVRLWPYQRDILPTRSVTPPSGAVRREREEEGR